MAFLEVLFFEAGPVLRENCLEPLGYLGEGGRQSAMELVAKSFFLPKHQL